MNSPSPTRTQRRAADMRRTLVEIAEALLMEGGVAAVTTEEIARRADVSLQTVYNRVGGKPALLLAIAERAMAENRAYIDAAYDSDGTPEERAQRIFLAFTRFALERPQQFAIIVNPPDESEAVARIAAMAAEQNARLANLIRDGIAEGRVNPGLDPDTAANALWAMMNGVMSLALRNDAMRPAAIRPEALMQVAWTLLEFGIRVR